MVLKMLFFEGCATSGPVGLGLKASTENIHYSSYSEPDERKMFEG